MSANVVDSEGHPVTDRAYTIKSAGRLRVAVIGMVMGDLLGNYTTPDQLKPWHVLPVVEAVRGIIPQVRNRADIIIVLGHIHDEETNRILRELTDVSVVVAGHEHKGYAALKRVDGRIAVQGKSYGVELGRLDLQFDTAHRKIVSAEWKRIPVDSHHLAPAPAVAQPVAKWDAKVAATVDIPIGESRRRITGKDLRDLVERAMVEQMGADFAFVNSGNLRDVLPEGRLLARHVWNILPFDNRVVMGKFRGRDLPPVVTAGRTLDPDREYTLATTDFAAINQASKDQMDTTGLKFPRVGPLQRDLVIDWIRKTKILE